MPDILDVFSENPCEKFNAVGNISLDYFNHSNSSQNHGDKFSLYQDNPCHHNASTSVNETFEQYEFPIYRHSLGTTIVYSVAYLFVFVVGLVGNILVMMVVYRTRVMKTTVFYFLFNLALADLLVIIFCVPITLISNVYTGKSY